MNIKNIRRIAGFILSLISVAGINFVPLEMWLYDDFSGVHTMILYALENALLIFPAVVFVLLCAPKQDQSGKFRRRRDILVFYLTLAISFSVGSCLFFSFYIYNEAADEISFQAISAAMKWIVGFLILEFFADFLMLGRLTLLQAELFLNRSLGRVFLFFLSVFIGYFLIVFGEKWFVIPFIALKTMADIGQQIELFTGGDKLDAKENPLTKNYGQTYGNAGNSQPETGWKVTSNIYFRKQF